MVNDALGLLGADAPASKGRLDSGNEEAPSTYLGSYLPRRLAKLSVGECTYAR